MLIWRKIMIKSIVMHDIPISHVAAMERWYFREHAPEINRRFGLVFIREKITFAVNERVVPPRTTGHSEPSEP